MSEMSDINQVPPGVDPATPSPARMYDYMLGGTHNFQADRDAIEVFRAQWPDIEDMAWANRGFHGRAAVWMAQHGIRQFIDLGSGLPTQNNTHEAVQGVAAGIRVVYVDNDPIVAAYAKALLTGDRTTTVVTADLCDPQSVLSSPGLRELIDFSQPTGVLMTAVLHFLPDSADPWGRAARYMAAMAPGSYLAVSHATYDNLPLYVVQAARQAYSRATANAHPRSKAEVERFFDGLQIVPPYPGAEASLTYIGSWGAEDPELADSDGSRALYCAVARRP
jgi:hypothetical protein